MGVSFQWLGEKDGYSICLDDSEFAELQPAFNDLWEKTGILIDGYSDCRLSPDHANILLPNIQMNKRLTNMFRICVSESKWIFIVGD